MQVQFGSGVSSPKQPARKIARTGQRWLKDEGIGHVTINWALIYGKLKTVFKRFSRP